MTRTAPVLIFFLAGCASSTPHRPPSHAQAPDDDGDALARSGEPDPFDIDSALPRSGDPARPNVKVEVKVVDVVSERGLAIRGGVRGSIVQGVVDLRAGIEGGAGGARARSSTTTFVVAQAGRSAALMLTDDCRRWCGPYAGIDVHVVRANAREAEVMLAPYLTPGTRGDSIEGATRVTVGSGQAIVIGGYTSDDDASSRGLGGVEERRARRQVLVLLVVKVIG